MTRPETMRCAAEQATIAAGAVAGRETFQAYTALWDELFFGFLVTLKGGEVAETIARTALEQAVVANGRYRDGNPQSYIACVARLYWHFIDKLKDADAAGEEAA